MSEPRPRTSDRLEEEEEYKGTKFKLLEELHELEDMEQQVFRKKQEESITFTQLVSTMEPWVASSLRIRALTPKGEYVGIPRDGTANLLNVMYETNLLFSRAHTWVRSMKIVRRNFPVRRFPWDASGIQDAGETVLGFMRVFSDFQQGLMESGFSFNNILMSPSRFQPFLGIDERRRVSLVLQILVEQLKREGAVWHHATKGATPVGLHEGDKRYVFLLNKVTAQPEDNKFSEIPDPWADYEFEDEDYGPDIELPTATSSTVFGTQARGQLIHPDAGDIPEDDEPVSVTEGENPSRRTSLTQSVGTSRRLSADGLVYLAQGVADQPSHEASSDDIPLPQVTVARDVGMVGGGTPTNRGVSSAGSGVANRGMSRNRSPTGTTPASASNGLGTHNTSGGGASQPQTMIPMISPAVFGMQQLSVFDGKGTPKENREWFEQFEFLAQSCRWSAQQKTTTLKYYCKGAAREWWSYQTRGGTQNWGQLRPIFIHEFCTDRRSKTQMYITARQKKDETPLEYFRRLTNLGKRAKADLQNVEGWEEHVDLFVAGLHSETTRNQLRVLAFNDPDEVESTLERIERTSRNSRLQPRDDDDPTPRPGASKTKFRTRTPQPPLGETETRSRTKTNQVYLVQSESEPEDEEPEWGAYSFPDEHGNDQVYLARTKDVGSSDSRQSARDDYSREKCPTCGKLGHSAAKCWLKVKCTDCGGVGHPPEVCYRRCGFCEKVHDKKGPCPLKASVVELMHWAKTTANVSGKSLPVLPEQLLNW